MAPDPRGPTAPDELGIVPDGGTAAGRWRRALGRGVPLRLPGALRTPRARAAGHRALRALGVLTVVVAGSSVGTALTPAVGAHVGPLRLDVRVVPSLQPGVELLLPPAGQVRFDTHLAPIAIEAAVSEVDLDETRALIASPGGLRALQAEAPDEMRTATLRAGALSAGFALAGAVGAALLVYRSQWRRTRQAALTMAGVLGLTALTTGLTFRSDSFAQPHFEGLLSQAPYVAAQTSGLVQRLESYRSGLADIVQSVTTLYGTSNELPVLPGGSAEDVVTVLHVSDMHLNPLGFDLTERLVKQFGVDAVVDTGDITTWGTEVESTILSRIRDVGVPYVFVRGNHDSGLTQQAVAANPNAVVLDGRAEEVAGLVFAGVGDPRFTPDGTDDRATPAEPTTAAPSPPAPPSGAASSGGTGSPGASPSASSPSPAPSTAAGAIVPGEDPEIVEGRRLARVVRDWNAQNPGRPVAVAAFHEPAGTPPLDGLVPLVLSGHMHTRSTEEYPNGTRLMIQGSTGGAGFDSLTRDPQDPVPLNASVLYFARSGERAGQLLAYDDVTVGGFGLASVSLERTVVRARAGEDLAPGDVRGAVACPSRRPDPGPGAAIAPTSPPDGASGQAVDDDGCVTGVTSSGSRSIPPAPSG